MFGGLSSCRAVCIGFSLEMSRFGLLGTSVSILARASMDSLNSVTRAHLGSSLSVQTFARLGGPSSGSASGRLSSSLYLLGPVCLYNVGPVRIYKVLRDKT